MSAIVDIVDTMLRTIVAAKGLGVLERLPLPVTKAPRRMILNLLEHTMCRHYRPDVVLHHPCPPPTATASAGWQQREARRRRTAQRRQHGGLAGNVADMSRHVADDTSCRSNFGQMGPCRRHFFSDVVAVCVGLS